MSDELIEAVLRSQELLVPFHFHNSIKQVEAVITFQDEMPVLYEFHDHMGVYLGPIAIVKSTLPVEQIRFAVNNLNHYERLRVRKLSIVRTGVIIKGNYEPVIDGIELYTEEECLRMTRSGAAYPYALALNTP